MAQFVSGFIATDVGDVYLALVRLERAVVTVRRNNPKLAVALNREAKSIRFRFEQDLRRVERTSSARITRGMRERVTKTAVRAGTSGNMRDALIARPIQFALPTGSIGIADIPALDAVVNPRSPRYGPYWRTQEYGYAGHVGREVKGGFYSAGGGGPYKPTAADFRQHPIFIPGKGGKMVIGRPIRARHFIRDTIDAERALWLAEMEGVQAKVLGRLASIGTLFAP